MTRRKPLKAPEDSQRVRITVDIFQKLHKRAKKFAETQDIPLHKVITEAIETFFDIEGLINEIIRLIAPDLGAGEVSIERVARRTFLIKWRSNSGGKEVIIRDTKHYKLES